MNNSSWKEELQSLAASQWGLFTAAQARELGIQRNQVARLVKRRLVESVDYGVYRFSSGYEASHTDLKAAWLSLYPKKTAYERMAEQPLDAVVRGRTAAFLHDLGDFYPTPFSFAVSKRRQTRRDNIHCLLEEVDPQDIVFVDSLPVTSVEKTIADLIREGEDPTLLGQAIGDAARGGHEFDFERLSTLLALLSKKYGYSGSDGGTRFALDLLKKDASGIQLEMANSLINRALMPSIDPLAMMANVARETIDVRPILEAIEESGFLCSQLQTICAESALKNIAEIVGVGSVANVLTQGSKRPIDDK